MNLWSQIKRTWFQAQIKQAIAISIQFEHERHSTHKRRSYIIFTKGSHPQAYISHNYQEHNYTSHEHHKQSHNLISSISWWSKHMREAHLYDIWYKCSLWYKDATRKHDMIHKWEFNMHMYINPPNRGSKGENDSKLSLQTRKYILSKGLVRISASCFSVGTWMRCMFPFSALSLRKWYLTSICFVLEWSMGFLATLMALVLSHMTGTWEDSSPKSLNFCSRLGDTRLFARRQRDKWRTQKLASIRSWFPIDSTPCKVSIQKTKKQKGWGRREPKTKLRSVSKIPEDLLDGLPMWSPRWCLWNECIETQKTRWLATSPSSTRGSRSCSATPSGPRAPRPHPCRVL
jgi:hypothetical protein